jgi:hypothetical protein
VLAPGVLQDPGSVQNTPKAAYWAGASLMLTELMQ